MPPSSGFAVTELALSGMGAEEIRLWDSWRVQGDEAARSRLMEVHVPYARVVAATYYARRTHDEVEFTEYLQLASLALLECIDRFDPSQGAQFRTFAARRMHGAILDGLTKCSEKNQQIAAQTRLRKERLMVLKAGATDKQDSLLQYLAEVGIGIALGVLLENTGMVESEVPNQNGVVPSSEVSYFRETEIRRLRGMVNGLLKHLNAQEQLVLRYHYLQEYPFTDIAEELGLSKGRISQIHSKALNRLRDLFADSQLCDVIL